MIQAFAIKAPDGRLLMMFVGPDESQLKYRFLHDNRQISWRGYKVVQVEIVEVQDEKENE